MVLFITGCLSCKEKEIQPTVQIYNSDFEKNLVESGKDTDGLVNGKMSVVDQKKTTHIHFFGFMSSNLSKDRANFDHITLLQTETDSIVFDIDEFPKLDLLKLRTTPDFSKTSLHIKGSSIEYLELNGSFADSINISGLDFIRSFYFSGTPKTRYLKLNESLSTLRISGAINLRELNLSSSRHNYLPLINVFIGGTGIRSLSLFGCRDLISLDCRGNMNLRSLDIFDVKNLNLLDTRNSFIREICVNDLGQAELRTKLVWYYSPTPNYFFNIENGTKFVKCR